MRETVKLIKYHIFLLFIILPLYSPIVYADGVQTKHVLVLNSYQKGFPWTDDIVKGIESVFKSGENNTELTLEYMDTKTIGYETEYKEQLYDLYKYKYKKRKIDLIISSDDNALNFLREYHEDLFPGVSIVFCGVNNLDISNNIEREVFTGLVELHSIKETIDIALRLHHGTRQIVFVVDNSPTGTYFWNQIQGLFKYYEDTRMIRIDNSLSMEQIEDKVSRLSDDTIVYWGTLHSDKYGKYYSFGESALRVSKASSRPMYGHSVEILPYGIVGGKLLGGFYNGQVAAEMAQRILKGEKVRDIPVLTESQTQYMFNNEEMQRFCIDISDLPEDSIVVNKPFSFYEENKGLIGGVIVVIVFQTLIIIGLVVYRLKSKQAEKALIQTKEQYRMVVEQAGQMTYDYNIPTGRISWSGDVPTITGFTVHEFQKVDISGWKQLIHPDDREAALEMLDEAMSKCSNYQVEYRFKHKDGIYLYMEDSGLFLTDKNGNAHQMLGIVKDITERKQAEKELTKHREHLEELIRGRTVELKKRISEVEKLNSAMVNLVEDLRVSNEKLEMSTQQLDNANKELEAFAYSVSHDLRSPLRGIDGFSQALLEDYADKLDKDGRHYLERVRAGTQRMGRLIDDILQLSRDGRRKMKPEIVDLSVLARKISGELEKSGPERKVQFIIKEGLVVNGDAHLLQIVFNNMLENAWKFTSKRSEAQIEFGVTEKEGKSAYFVKDNGVGFDMKYAGKLFTPFHRLHRAEEFEGTGIGLANVQRIITRHGGRIWVESEKDVGTTFYFTLPRS